MNPDTLKPRDAKEVEETVRWALAAAKTLELVGGGTKRAIGRAAQWDATLDLSGLAGVTLYEPAELVLSAKAATPLAEIEALVAASGQQLAFEPVDYGALLGTVENAGTIGGALAANLSGPRRVKAGAARDHFLGFTAVNGSGEIFKGGGPVVKNVTGYDLPKLLAGSWGTLAVLTELTVRVLPAAEHELTLLFAPRGVSEAVNILSRALATTCEVSAAALVPGEAIGLRLEGFAESVRARATRLGELLGLPQQGTLADERSRSWWAQVGAADLLADEPLVWRVSLPPTEVARVVRELAPRRYLIDWGGGLLWLGAPHCEAERVRAVVPSGHATLIKAPPAVRAVTRVFPPLPPALAAVTARLKAAFDPAGRLNPGRMS